MTVDSIVDAVRRDLLERSQLGIAKYGVTLDRRDLTLREWLQHAYEETLDQANYLKRAIVEIDRNPARSAPVETIRQMSVSLARFTAADARAAVSRDFTDKQVFNALGYLVRSGRLRRVGYGRYEAGGVA